MSIKEHQWWKRHCPIKWTEWLGQLMSVILCHWWSQCWHNELINVVVIVAEMEAIHGPKSMGFHFPFLITTVANKYPTLEINIKWDLICLHQSLRTLTSYLAASWIHCTPFTLKGAVTQPELVHTLNMGLPFLPTGTQLAASPKGLHNLVQHCSDQGTYFKIKWQSVYDYMIFWSYHILLHSDAAGLIEWWNERSFRICQLGDDTIWWWSTILQDTVYSPNTYMVLCLQTVEHMGLVTKG